MDNSLILINKQMNLLPNDEVLNEQLEGWSRKARAIKTHNRLHVRRASSEKTLDEILPSDFLENDTYHILSAGDVDALSFANHIIKHNSNIEYLAFSTWCMSSADIAVFGEWLNDKKVNRIDAYLGEIFQGTYSKEFTELVDVIRPYGGRVCVFRNHSKVFLIKTPTQYFTIQSSANINTNPRCENTSITCSEELYEHHKYFFDEIRAFNKDDFPNWSPL